MGLPFCFFDTGRQTSSPFPPLQEFIRPTQTVVNHRNLNLSSLGRFPVVFKVCIKPGYQLSAVQEAGYEEVAYYFIGRSKYNKRHISWAGHTSQGEVISNVSDILARVTTRNHASLKAVKVWTKTEKFVSLPSSLLQLRRTNYPDNCIRVDLGSQTHLVKEGILQLFFRFHPVPEFSAVLRIEDRERSLDRADKFAVQAYSGPIIVMENFTRSKRMEYMVQMERKVFVERDPAQACRIYPNSEFETFNDCDLAWMRRGVGLSYPSTPPSHRSWSPRTRAAPRPGWRSGRTSTSPRSTT